MKVRVIATSRYEKQVNRLLSGVEKDAMQESIAADPEAHPVIPGTGGVRKARWGRQGKGKSGGVRVIYYFWVGPNAVVMISVYAKNEKENLSDADKKEIRKIVGSIKKS